MLGLRLPQAIATGFAFRHCLFSMLTHSHRLSYGLFRSEAEAPSILCGRLGLPGKLLCRSFLMLCIDADIHRTSTDPNQSKEQRNGCAARECQSSIWPKLEKHPCNHRTVSNVLGVSLSAPEMTDRRNRRISSCLEQVEQRC